MRLVVPSSHNQLAFFRSFHWALESFSDSTLLFVDQFWTFSLSVSYYRRAFSAFDYCGGIVKVELTVSQYVPNGLTESHRGDNTRSLTRHSVNKKITSVHQDHFVYTLKVLAAKFNKKNATKL